ncbi:ATP-binding protein [Desulfomonile tiedjei]|nr:ATP-binding protein [Desulfomonile tiedjei]
MRPGSINLLKACGMISESGSETTERFHDRDSERSRLEKAIPISSRQPGWIVNSIYLLEKILPKALKPRPGVLLSFKNRILLSTFLVMIGVVITIGIILQVTVFPQLGGDSPAIKYLKVIHLFVSLVVIALSCLFIERISKKITMPLIELTSRADQISREAGASTASSDQSGNDSLEQNEGAVLVQGDEIHQLTVSFNRMLVHLKASEARLRESEEKYRFLFDNGPFPIFLIDAETTMILDVNARAEEDYQYAREQLLAMSFADLGLDQDRKATVARLQQLFSTEVTLLPVMQHRRRNGSLFMVNYQASLITYQNRPAIIAAVWDVTERLEKHSQLIQAGKMATLGEMATGIAHELNQPLSVIRLGCDYLLKTTQMGKSLAFDDMKNITEDLTASVDRASRIINHLRQFGRKTDETMTRIDINDPIRNVFTLLGTQLEANKITWNLRLSEDLPHIIGDANRLEQVFMNLILNARDAMLSGDYTTCEERESEHVIHIASNSERGRVVVTVSDTGPGIPQSIRDKIFEPFFTTKKIGEGTGLGLSISYGIIREHKGTIEVEPHYKKGASFRMTFPVPDIGVTS